MNYIFVRSNSIQDVSSQVDIMRGNIQQWFMQSESHRVGSVYV